jgi:hypothetical protein
MVAEVTEQATRRDEQHQGHPYLLASKLGTRGRSRNPCAPDITVTSRSRHWLSKHLDAPRRDLVFLRRVDGKPTISVL